MRGCDNMCTYCIVPFTRGRERSRPASSIISEVQLLSNQGVKEITLLGQNVNSYRDLSEQSSNTNTTLAKGFRTVYKPKMGGLRFADLLERVADVNPEIRIRFTSPHPKDFPDRVLDVIKSKPNVCKNLHIPAQSGNSNVLERMRRGYSRESYIDLINHIRDIIPEVTLSSDFIAGFCNETDDEFQDTISLMDSIRYNVAYMFAYSMREKTTAHRRFKDDVPDDVKKDRVRQMSEVFRRHAESLNKAQIRQRQLVLVEGASKRSDRHLVGRNDGNVKVIFPKIDVPVYGSTDGGTNISVGDYVVVDIDDGNSQVLKGTPLFRTSLVNYHNEIK